MVFLLSTLINVFFGMAFVFSDSDSLSKTILDLLIQKLYMYSDDSNIDSIKYSNLCGVEML